MLKDTYFRLLQNFSSNTELVAASWQEIAQSYSAPGRHYHTLQHLDHLLLQLLPLKATLQHWEAILFALYYHDVVYHSQQSDNEERSAAFAAQKMRMMAVPPDVANLCKEHILATKAHTPTANADTNYFTDADLSILGQTWETYSEYFRQIRNEYSIYPDEVYIPGRVKVLKHFLAMPRIFKTDYFYEQLEVQARLNLAQELNLL